MINRIPLALLFFTFLLKKSNIFTFIVNKPKQLVKGTDLNENQ